MRKILLILLLIVCAAACVSGFARPKTVEIVYETVVYAEPGDGLDVLIGDGYDKCTNGICWDEYRSIHRKLNAELFKNGRALQVGDPVRVQWYVVREIDNGRKEKATF